MQPKRLILLTNDSVGHIHQTILDEISEQIESLPQEQKETIDRKLTDIISDLESLFNLVEKLKNDNK